MYPPSFSRLALFMLLLDIRVSTLHRQVSIDRSGGNTEGGDQMQDERTARSDDDDLRALQHGVQRQLGLCLLWLQHYERLLKAFLADQALSASVDTIENAKAERISGVERQTLGALVNQLLGSYFTTNANPPLSGDDPEADDGVSTFSFWAGTILSDDDYKQLSLNLKELVALRNRLVHHFIDAYDLGSVQGCKTAQNALGADLERIKLHYTDLRAWVEEMVAIRAQMAEVLQSPEIHDWIVTGKTPWPQTEIVAALRAALTELAVDGWATIADAVDWIARNYPEETPSHYGCRSWPQLLHECRLFQIEYREADGRRVRWFREKGGISHYASKAYLNR